MEQKWNRSGTEEENDGKLVKIGGKIGQNWWKKWSKRVGKVEQKWNRSGTEVEQKWNRSGTEVEQKWNRRGK